MSLVNLSGWKNTAASGQGEKDALDFFCGLGEAQVQYWTQENWLDTLMNNCLHRSIRMCAKRTTSTPLQVLFPLFPHLYFSPLQWMQQCCLGYCPVMVVVSEEEGNSSRSILSGSHLTVECPQRHAGGLWEISHRNTVHWI